jgi:hypothetical protein
VQRCTAARGALGWKKLRRLQHIFTKVQELSFCREGRGGAMLRKPIILCIF